ncbi:MAG: signal peptide peptidase SppA [Pseudomonadota bacterium]
MSESRNPIVRLFSFIWRGFNALRKVLHFVLLLMIFMVIITIMSPEAPVLPERAALVINPQGQLTEQLAGTPFDRAIDEITGQAVPQTLVRDVVDALDMAVNDDAIGAVYVSLDGLAGGSMSEIQAVARAMTDFRNASDKPLVARAGFMSQTGYYLAAHADEVMLDPRGIILIQGFGRFRNFYAEAIEKLSIQWNVYKVGTHKSFVEPYLRNSMSDEDRDNSGRLLGELWEQYVSGVESARELPAGTIQNLADNLDQELAADDGDIGATALRLGLVDTLATASEMRAKMIDLVGTDESDESTFSQIGFKRYIDTKRALTPTLEGDDVVAVVVASGSIVDGNAAPGSIGGDSTARLLREARTDDKVKAVVLRVDSGGGSAFASDVISDEIKNLQEAGKPVIASMGGVAASGGYWISMAADQIIAEPVTVTGSIGIFGMFPTIEDSLARLGVTTDGVGTAALSNALRMDLNPTEQVDRILQLNIENGYDRFIGAVAGFREMSLDAVDQVAQGQVWSGVTALQHGLVDSIGTQSDAVAIAAELASLDSYDIRYIEPQLSDEEQLLLSIIDGSVNLGLSPSVFARKRSKVESLIDFAEAQLENITRFNDPRGVYADCLCDFNF